MEVSFESEQSIMAMQMAKAEEYVDALKEIYAPSEEKGNSPTETDKAVLSILEFHQDIKDPEVKLLVAEWLTDAVISMVELKILNAREPIVQATLNYREEMFAADIYLKKIEVMDINRCDLCSSRPAIFPESKACVTCKLTDFRANH